VDYDEVRAGEGHKLPTSPRLRRASKALKKRLNLRTNPKPSRMAQIAISAFDTDLDLDLDTRDIRRLQRGEKKIRKTRKPKRKNPSRSHIATAAEFKRLEAITRKLRSRIKNALVKRNPVGWFRDVSPVTA